jgi:membrane protein DedA with SNARE-associated domain
MPFKIFVVTAGVLGYPATRFAIVIMLARTLRYYFWGVLAWFFRDEVRQMIDWLGRHVVAILGAILVLLLIVLTSRWLIIQRTRRAARLANTDTVTDTIPD